MTEQRITKQIIDFQNATLENTFNAIIMFQDRAEKMTTMFLQTSICLLSEEEKKILPEYSRVK